MSHQRGDFGENAGVMKMVRAVLRSFLSATVLLLVGLAGLGALQHADTTLPSGALNPFTITYSVLQFQIPPGAAVTPNASFVPTPVAAFGQGVAARRILIVTGR